MPQARQVDPPQVFEADVVPAVQQRPHLGGQHQRLRTARAAPQRMYLLVTSAANWPSRVSGQGQPDGVVLHVRARRSPRGLAPAARSASAPSSTFSARGFSPRVVRSRIVLSSSRVE